MEFTSKFVLKFLNMYILPWFTVLVYFFHMVNLIVHLGSITTTFCIITLSFPTVFPG